MCGVRFDASAVEFACIVQIADRAALIENAPNKLTILMDLEAVHCNDVKLDFEKFLQFDDFNFKHDLFGIWRHIDRSTGKLKGHFLPRCAINSEHKRMTLTAEHATILHDTLKEYGAAINGDGYLISPSGKLLSVRAQSIKGNRILFCTTQSKFSSGPACPSFVQAFVEKFYFWKKQP